MIFFRYNKIHNFNSTLNQLYDTNGNCRVIKVTVNYNIVTLEYSIVTV